MVKASGAANDGTVVIMGVTSDKQKAHYDYIQINQAEANVGLFLLGFADSLKAIAHFTRISWGALGQHVCSPRKN